MRPPLIIPNYDWRPMTDLVQPIHFGWLVQNAHGFHWLRLHIELPASRAPNANPLRWGELFASIIWAPHMSSSAAIIGMDVAGPGSSFAIPVWFNEPITGKLILPQAPANRTPVIALLSGHPDNKGIQRLYIPGTPILHTDGDRLNAAGYGSMLGLARKLVLGMGKSAGIAGERLFLYRPPVEGGPGRRPVAAGYRDVSSARVLSYTYDLPDSDPVGNSYPY